jgi:hypothetical protein
VNPKLEEIGPSENDESESVRESKKFHSREGLESRGWRNGRQNADANAEASSAFLLLPHTKSNVPL